MDKKDFRSYFLQKRKKQKPVPPRLLVHQLVQVLPTKKRVLCAGYMGKSHELDPRPSLVLLSQFDWCYPRVEGQFLKFFKTQKIFHLPQNQWGIEEPDPQVSEEVLLQNCLAILVPGVCFDEKGSRIGSGCGFYDRNLVHFKGLKVGVCFECQLSKDTLPVEDHDIRMDVVVTEKSVLKW